MTSFCNKLITCLAARRVYNKIDFSLQNLLRCVFSVEMTKPGNLFGVGESGRFAPTFSHPLSPKALSLRVARPNKFGAHNVMTRWNRFLPAVEKTRFHTGLYGVGKIGRFAPDFPHPPLPASVVSFRCRTCGKKSPEI